MAHPEEYDAVTGENSVTRRQVLAGAAGLALPATAGAGAPRAVEASPKGKARVEAARRGLAQVDRGPGGADYGLVRVWARRVADAELALCCRPAERKVALEAYVRRARDAERVVRAEYKKGAVALMDVLEAEFFRADAEALLAEEEVRQADGGCPVGGARPGLPVGWALPARGGGIAAQVLCPTQPRSVLIRRAGARQG